MSLDLIFEFNVEARQWNRKRGPRAQHENQQAKATSTTYKTRQQFPSHRIMLERNINVNMVV